MSGCLAVGSSLYAYGTATGSSGAPVPAVWRSADGTSWARSPVGAFVPGTPTPLLSVAPAGSVWLAAANPDPDADPLQPAGAGSPGPGATAAGDAGVGPAPSLEDGRDGVWLSITAGSTWQLIDTLTGPWLGAERSEVDLVGFAGHGSAAKPVVVGVVDGELAVWAGTAVF
jgi:hypothetical protein